MKTSLQHMFIESLGKPVKIGPLLVKQRENIPIESGFVTIRFLSGDYRGGIRLKCKNGWIKLSDGTHSKIVDTWRLPHLSNEITYEVSCSDGCLWFWNIYQIEHIDGTVTEDMWTGNAGMVEISKQLNKGVYGCSSGGGGDFDPEKLVVEIQWSEYPREPS